MRIMLTGVAGFIGSHILSRCLRDGHSVVGIDNFLTGKQENLDAVCAENSDAVPRFEFHRADIRDAEEMKKLAAGADVIIHEAAIGSVPWSIREPMLAHETNLTGFLNILEAARANGIRRVVYASSSAVFGDADGIPAVEGEEGSVLSVYASSKRAQEIYAEAYAACYDLEIIGLRYFNVFGVRQDPQGPYAAVIPKWINAMLAGEACKIFGDGHSTRDYCHVSNVVNANMLAAVTDLSCRKQKAYAMNIGCGRETSLLELHENMRLGVEETFGITVKNPEFCPPRLGDIERSVADISRARQILGFEPGVSVAEGLSALIREMRCH